ncbi:MAG TPA: ATPase, T2SS/T4P/T4SS family [Candidatus Norongarragalinales archaeon]|jgi:Flp pilus assembly CpaF family ATPase|nr:ATPase, T2SS/T4P/T4SS family [Candidatus Norongarragalinales archaeon]
MDTWRLDKPLEGLFNIEERELSTKEKTLARAVWRAQKQHSNIATEKILSTLCASKRIFLPSANAKRIITYLQRETSGFGLLDELLKNQAIEEIALPSPKSCVFAFMQGEGWKRTNLYLQNTESGVELANKMARDLGRRLTANEPRLSATLPNGSRLHATMSPLAPEGFEFTIRKFREKPFSITELIRSRTISARAAAFLWLALQSDSSLLIAGNTGSGKTTTLNALFTFVPLQERIVVTEETPELSLPQKHVAKLVARPELGVTMHSLVRDTLRMRPDRVIVGEVRDEQEASALFDALLAGQARGTYATFHANSAKEALNRLEALGARRSDLDALDYVIVQRRSSFFDRAKNSFNEQRCIIQIARVENGEASVLFELNDESHRLEQVREPDLRRIARTLKIDERSARKELARRSEFLMRLAQENPPHEKTIAKIQSFAPVEK